MLRSDTSRPADDTTTSFQNTTHIGPKFKRLNLDPNKVERLCEKLFISLVETETGAIPRTSDLDDGDDGNDGEDSDDGGSGARQVCQL